MIKAKVTPDAIVEVAKSGVLIGVDEELVAQLKPSHVAVSCSLLHYGKGEHNPLDEVTFYSKKKPNGASSPWRCFGESALLIMWAIAECGKANYSDISLLMPKWFAEVWLRVYTKDETFHGLIQAAYRHILKNLTSASDQSVEEAQEEGFNPDILGGPVVVGGDLDLDLDLEPVKAWRPETPTLGNGPSTPGGFSRNVSAVSASSASGLGTISRRPSRTVGRTPSFSENQFTAVPPNFRGESPSRKPKSKRGRDVSDSLESGRPRKSLRTLAEKGADAS